jgi:hypothetical protein
MVLLRRLRKGSDLKQPVRAHGHRFRVHHIAAELILAAVSKAQDMQAVGCLDNARGIAAAGFAPVKEQARCDAPRPARMIGDQVMVAGDRALRV